MSDTFLQPNTILKQGDTVRVEFDYSSQAVTPDVLLAGLNAENASGVTWTDATLPIFGHGEVYGVVTYANANTSAIMSWLQAVADATPDFSINVLGVYLTNGRIQAGLAESLGLPASVPSLPSLPDVTSLVKWLVIGGALLGGFYVFKTLRTVGV